MSPHFSDSKHFKPQTTSDDPEVRGEALRFVAQCHFCPRVGGTTLSRGQWTVEGDGNAGAAATGREEVHFSVTRRLA